MSISLNQFAPNTPVPGLYVYMANLPQLHNVILAASQTVSAGAIVTLDATATNANAPVAKQAAVTDAVFGVVTYNPTKNTFTAGDRIAIARENDIVWLTAAGAVAEGADLYFTSANKVTSTATAGNSIVGKALTPASADGDLIQVELHFATTAAE